MFEPRLLNLCAGIRLADSFDRDDLRAADAVDRRDAGPRGDPIDVNGAGAAQRRAATELRTGHAENVAQDPEQWRVAVDVDVACGSVDLDGERHDMISIRVAGSARTWRARYF